MSLQAMNDLAGRVRSDAAFREQIKSSPESALAGYDLTADERATVLRSNLGELSDEELSQMVGGVTPDSAPWFRSGGTSTAR